MKNKFLKRRILMFMLGVFFVWSSGILAQDISFEAFVDRKNARLGQSVQLTLRVEGAKSSSPIQLPAIDGLKSQYVGPSTQVQIYNGQYSSSTSYFYLLYPQRTGTFQIPALTMTIDGKEYTSLPIDLEVSDAPVAAAPAPGASAARQGQGTGAPVKLEDKVFMVLESPRKEVYLNQKVPLLVKVYAQGVQLADLSALEMDQTGFTRDQFLDATRSEETIGGILYNVLELKFFIYPTRIGDLTLGPASLQCNLVSPGLRRRSLLNDPGGFFDDDFFDSFFGTVEKTPLTLKTSDLRLTVLPFPSEGKPDDFSEAVGRFDFQWETSPQEVAAGDPVTIRLKISGDGNLKSVKMPEFKEDQNFKVYPLQMKEDQRAMVAEQVIIPKSEAVSEIPALSFSYFDPDSKAYQTLTRGPFALKVRPAVSTSAMVAAPAPVISSQPAAVTPEETLGQDIIFIKDHPGAWALSADVFLKSGAYKFSWIVLTLAGLALGGVLVFRRRVDSDVAYARRLQAPKKAREGMAQLKALAEQNKVREFYDLLFEVFQEYFGDKFHLPSQTLTWHNLNEALGPRNPDPVVLEKLKKLFEDCDAVRFAGEMPQAPELSAALRDCAAIIDHFERTG